MRVISSLARLSRWGLLVGLGGCVEQYLPDELPSTAPTFLVVDGFINGNGRTRVSLSRAQALTATTAPLAVRGALLFIVDELGQRYPLRESALPGVPYTSDSLRLDPARRYRLRIQLGTAASAPTYESDLTQLKVTPDFDQLELVHVGDNFELQATTHDPTGQSRYYRWRTIETWRFNSGFDSKLDVKKVSDGTVVVPRTTPIYTCYRTEIPSAIRQVSTVALSQDVVNRQSILSFSDRAERIKVRYSVLVSQVAETPEEYAYYELLRKNTEAIGTVNDPLPSQLTGNVHRVGNRSETVLGFVGAHTVVQRRLFATPASLGLPLNWVFRTPYDDCQLGLELVPNPADRHPIYRPYTQVFAAPENVPVNYHVQGLDTLGYDGGTRTCVDCRVRGTTTPPSFW